VIAGWKTQGHLWAPFSTPLNAYQASLFKLAECPRFRIGLDTPVPQHEVGDSKGVGLPQPPEVPES
jgi:hypothetical protein